MWFQRKHQNGSLWTGMAAGAAGGLAASWVMGVAHQRMGKLAGASPRAGVQATNTEAAARAAGQVAGRELSTAEKYLAGSVMHYLVGSAAGALYGAAAAVSPKVRKGAGLPFGTAVWAGLHLGATPALGLAHPYEAPIADEAVEFASHLVYGLTTEAVRRSVLATVRAAAS